MGTSKLIAGNWKMNCLKKDGVELARSIALSIKTHPVKNELLICPPATLIHVIYEQLKETQIKIGGQDCSENENGAYTGDISAEMLKDLGCDYVILGHSERRKNHNEQSGIIKKKGTIAHKKQIKTIICVGENIEDRNKGKYQEVVKDQILSSLPASANNNNTLIAYEPVWAIGTGKTAATKQIEEVHGFIKNIIPANIRVIYGGSVKSETSSEILSVKNVDGLLVGGASLIVEEFSKIIFSAEN